IPKCFGNPTVSEDWWGHSALMIAWSFSEQNRSPFAEISDSNPRLETCACHESEGIRQMYFTARMSPAVTVTGGDYCPLLLTIDANGDDRAVVIQHSLIELNAGALETVSTTNLNGVKHR